MPTLLAVGGLAEGPWIGVLEPGPDGWVTDPELVVSGNATPPQRVLRLGPALISSGTGQGLEWDGANLTMRPQAVFQDTFAGNSLDPERWTILRDQGEIVVEGGSLKLRNVGYTVPFPLVRSVQIPVTKGGDWTARFTMTSSAQYPYSGSGGGVSGSGTDRSSSHMAAYSQLTSWPNPMFSVYADGRPVYNLSWPDGVSHEYLLSYERVSDSFSVHFDQSKLATFVSSQVPNFFWFGASSTGPYQYYSHLQIDQVDLWTFSGSRTFDPVQLDAWSSIDLISLELTTDRDSDAEVLVEARASADNVTWGDWTTCDEMGVPQSPLEGEWLQLRVDLSLPEVRERGSYISLTGVDVHHHFPVTKVELRANDGDWVDATGQEQWSGRVQLREDMNTVHVRVTDTSGAVNATSFEQLLDTTPPVGTVRIHKDRQYTNDLNVTLSLNATDRYGVEYVQVANSPDMRGRVTFPYAPTLEWRMVGADGIVTCWVRFVDSHGLLSQVVSDSIFYDSIPPTGRVSIAGGKGYTPSLTVDLELEHSDTRGIALVEVSNHGNMSGALVVDPSQTVVPGWSLLAGGDGPRTVHMRLTDVAGNVRVVSDSIELYRPKALGGLVIEGGVEITRKTVVEVEIDVPYEALKPRLLQLSNEPAFINATWENVERTKRWILSPGDGPKTVFLRFLDFRDIVSLPVEASIAVDTKPPEVQVVIDEGVMYTTRTQVTVRLEVNDASPLVTMWVSSVDRFNEVDPRDYEDRFGWDVLAKEGPRHVYVQVRDQAGNEGQGHSSIHFATLRPEIRLELAERGPSNARDNISLKVVWIDPYGGVEVKLTLDQDPPDGAPWLPVEGTMALDLPPGLVDGWHEVRGVARNAAGLPSEVVTVRVRLDRTAPSVEVVSPKDGSTLSQKGLEILLELEALDATGISGVRYRTDGGEWRSVPRADLSVVIALEDFGDQLIDVEVTDGAGNTAYVSTSFRLEERESQVGSGLSWPLLLVIVLVVLVAGVGYQVLRRRGWGRQVLVRWAGVRGETGDADDLETKEVYQSPEQEVQQGPGAKPGPIAPEEESTPSPGPAPSGISEDGTEWQEF